MWELIAAINANGTYSLMQATSYTFKWHNYFCYWPLSSPTKRPAKVKYRHTGPLQNVWLSFKASLDRWMVRHMVCPLLAYSITHGHYFSLQHKCFNDVFQIRCSEIWESDFRRWFCKRKDVPLTHASHHLHWSEVLGTKSLSIGFLSKFNQFVEVDMWISLIFLLLRYW